MREQTHGDDTVEKPFEAASPDASHLTLSELPEIFQGLMSGPCCVRSVKSFGGS